MVVTVYVCYEHDGDCCCSTRITCVHETYEGAVNCPQGDRFGEAPLCN